MARFLVRQGRLIECHRLEVHPRHSQETQALLTLLQDADAAYLLPLVQENRLMAVVLLSEKTNGLLPYADADGAMVVAQRILEAVRAYRPEGDLAGQVEGITISIGRATCPADDDQADNLIKTADRLLYKAKASGKNRIAAVATRTACRRFDRAPEAVLSPW